MVKEFSLAKSQRNVFGNGKASEEIVELLKLQ